MPWTATRDEFLSVASHELKTPLTPLNIKLQTLRRELSAPSAVLTSERSLAHVEVAQRQVKKLAELVEDLLDVSRLGVGQLEHYGGLGLGLYITRRIVELSGGTVEGASHLSPAVVPARTEQPSTYASNSSTSLRGPTVVFRTATRTGASLAGRRSYFLRMVASTSFIS
jgi:signal transduction histidine kinase